MSEKSVKLPPVQYFIIVKTTKYVLLPSMANPVGQHKFSNMKMNY